MPKQEHKILEFHGGTNNKFDPRDVGDNQNTHSQFSINSPGRLTMEGAARTLYSKTNINGKTINSGIASGTGGHSKGRGLFSFSHDYNMSNANIVQSGTVVSTANTHWTCVDAAGGSDGWTNNVDPAVYEDSETSSMVNTLDGYAIDDGKTYRLSFEIGTGPLTLEIGGGNVSTLSDSYFPATSYAVGRHVLQFTATADRTHLWFRATGSGGDDTGTLDNVYCYKLSDETNTEFIVYNDANEIDIYDPNQATPGWQEASFKLGSRKLEVKPQYYNVDGGLRACDSNFGRTRADAGGDTITSAAIGLNDITISITDEGGGNVTINTKEIIQIDQEIMYVTSGGTGSSFGVIRGYANTKIQTHKVNTYVYYVNIPRYFGHIRLDRFAEAPSSSFVDEWVLDVQTPQPPNNTRTGALASPWISQSAGVQSLRVYDILEGATSNFPTESEKVILEFGFGNPDFGIKKVEASGNAVTITASGTAAHGLSVGDEIVISNVWTALPSIQGTHEVTATDETNNTFTIVLEDYDSSEVLDWSGGSYVTNIASFADNDATVPDTVAVTVDDSEIVSGNTQSNSLWIHITGQTGLDAFNGVYNATRTSDTVCYFKNASHASADSGDGTGTVQQLLGTVARVEGNSIDEDLRRKWNFAMSFTYDGPGQEVQESLLTDGYKVEAAVQDTGASNLHALGSTVALDATTIVVDDGDVFSAGDVIMIESEQMRVNSVDSNNLRIGVGGTNVAGRGFNGTTAATHADDLQVYKIEKLTPTATVDWTSQTIAPNAVIKFLYNHKASATSTWNPRINGFKIYMKDVTEGDSSKEWRLFSRVDFDKGTYNMFAAHDSEIILEHPGTWETDYKVSTVSAGTAIAIKPIDTYLSENLFTEQTYIDAQYKTSALVGRVLYVGNIKQAGRTYPDRMIRTPVNKFDTFPETHYIDVAVGDGDEITALMSYGDRLLQFKKNKVFVINVGGQSEQLEAEYNNAGIHMQSQVCKTSNGIAWVNSSGLWYFDGREVKNLTIHLQKDGFPNINSTAIVPIIGYDKINNRLIYTDKADSGEQTLWHIWDIELQAHQSHYKGFLFPTGNGTNYYTNIINDIDGNMAIGYVAPEDLTELNFYKWSSSDKGHQTEATDSLYRTKDIDFGSPSVRKKIYKIYVTYKSNGHSGVKLLYGTDGEFLDYTDQADNLTGTFSNSTYYDTAGGKGFLDTTGGDGDTPEWQVAELKPSSSINNVKSIRLEFAANTIHSGTATGGHANYIGLDATPSTGSTSTTDNDYNNYNIYIYDGPGRYNSRRIIDYDAADGSVNLMAVVYDSGASPTGTAFTDKGYAAAPTSSSKYILGSISPDFEINDITIIYRAKPVK